MGIIQNNQIDFLVLDVQCHCEISDQPDKIVRVLEVPGEQDCEIRIAFFGEISSGMEPNK